MKKLKKSNHILYHFLIAGTVVVSTGCDKKGTTDLKGERVSFLNFTASVKPDPSLSGVSVIVPAAVINSSWPQMGGRVDNALINVSLADTVNPHWQTPVGSGAYSEQRILASPITDENHIYTIDAEGVVFAVSIATGKIVWQKSTSPSNNVRDTLGGGIAVDKGVLFVTTSFGEVLALKTDSGDEIWHKTGYAPFRSSPSIKDSHLYCQSINNELITLSTSTGDLVWSHTGIPETALLLGSSKPACSEDSVVVAYTSGEVHALSQINGQPLWSDTITPVARIDTVTSIPHIQARPVIDENQVFLISHGGRMSCIDFKTGTRQWQKDLGGIQTPVVAGGFVFVLSNMNEVVCLERKTGSIRWVVGLPRVDEDEGSIHFAGPILAGGTLVLTSSKGEVIRIDPKNGEIKGKLKVEGSISLAPIVSKNTLYVLTDNAVLHAFQ